MFISFSDLYLSTLIIFVVCITLSSRFNLGLFLITLLFIYFHVYSIDYLDFSNFKVYFSLFLCLMYVPIMSMSRSESLDKKFLMSMVLLGSLILVNSENLMLIYLGLELQTFGLFILVSSRRDSIRSSEGGLKYFILGVISSGMFLLSVSAMYSSTGSLLLGSINYLNENSYAYVWKSVLLLSMFFKLSLFPLHFWIPDIYEASRNNVVGLLGTLPKFSVLGFIIQSNLFSNIIMWCAIGSILVGTIGALNQSKVKRLVAYSGVAHMGYGLITFGLFVKLGILPTLLYLAIYVAGFIPLVMLISYKNDNAFNYISDLSGLQNVNVTLCLSWSLFLLSMGGFPPLSGFLAKWWTIWTIVLNDYTVVAVVCVLISAVGLAYYLRITKISYFQRSPSYFVWKSVFSFDVDPTWNKEYLGFGLYLLCFLILNPNPLIITIDYVVASFF